MLKYFTMAVAKSLKHTDICQALKKKISEKFDGDYDVLWEQIKNTQISGQEMREMVNSRYSERTKQILTMEMIEEVPLLQVSLPVNFDDWDGESTILVTYTPLTSDDIEWEDIYAYDADLEGHILDAKTEPDFPVMVVGINERVDPETKKIKGNRNKYFLNKEAVDYTEYTDAILDYVYLYDDGEPWSKGAPEIYWLFGNTTMGTFRHNAFDEWSGWGTNRSWHHVHDVLFTWYSTYGYYFLINFMEEDTGSNTTFTAGGDPVSISYTINDKYDNLGSHIVNKNDPQTTKDDPYSTGSVYFVITWYEYTI